MRRLRKVSLLFALAAVFAAQAAFAAPTTPIYTITGPESVNRGDIFNAVVQIQSTAVPGEDYSADEGAYKFSGALFKLNFPEEDLEMVNKPQLDSAFTTVGLQVTDYYVTGGSFYMTVTKPTPDATVAAVSVPVDSPINFVTLTFKANRNSEGSAENGVDCEITIPADEDNTVQYQDGFNTPDSDATETINIKSDQETAGGEGDQTSRNITAKIALEYPAGGTSHATVLSALYSQDGDSNYVSYPGVSAQEDGTVEVKMERIAGKNFKIGFKRASTLISGLSGTDETTPDLSATVLKLVEGDFNSDNVVDGSDFTLLTQLINFPPTEVEGMAKTGDINNDGEINSRDVMSFNGVIQGTNKMRYLVEGFDMLTGGDNPFAETASFDAAGRKMVTINGRVYTAPKNSIVSVAPGEDGVYNISFTEDSKAINMLQLVIAGRISEEGFDIVLPEGWSEIGRKVEDGTVTFAIGNTEPEGLVIPKGFVFAKAESSVQPEVIYTGKTPSTMELATADSIQTYDFEAVSADAASGSSSGGSSGCNLGFGAAAPFLLACIIPGIARRRRKD